MIRQLIIFGGVGCSAMLVHWLSVISLVSFFDLTPLKANIIAFLIAFQVSYWGHRRWTFAKHHLSFWYTLPPFFATAVLSFIVNEALFYLLLRYTALPYQISLLFVLVFVAVFTFILSKYWAFKS